MVGRLARPRKGSEDVQDPYQSATLIAIFAAAIGAVIFGGTTLVYFFEARGSRYAKRPAPVPVRTREDARRSTGRHARDRTA